MILGVLNVEIRTLSDRPLKSGLMWLRELLHPMDSLERMYSPSIAMYPSKCVCIPASVPQWLKSEIAGSNAALAIKFQRKKFLPCSFVKIQYCWEPPRPRSSELGPRPAGFEFRSLCPEGSVISFISPSSGGSAGPV